MLTQESESPGRSGLQVIPAVDLLGGLAVRLERGAFDRIVAREADPTALVERFVGAGAKLLHVVDLEGARDGGIRPDVIGRLARAAAPARIQAAGGVRSLADAHRLLESGAARVVVGTAAFSRRGALDEYSDALGDRLVIAVDVRERRVLTSGWTEATEISVGEAVRRCEAAGVVRILCSATDRDGTLAGPDLELLEAVLASARGLRVLAAGGIRSVDDVSAVELLGCEGAIVGRALLDGALPLSILQRP